MTLNYYANTMQHYYKTSCPLLHPTKALYLHLICTKILLIDLYPFLLMLLTKSVPNRTFRRCSSGFFLSIMMPNFAPNIMQICPIFCTSTKNYCENGAKKVLGNAFSYIHLLLKVTRYQDKKV